MKIWTHGIAEIAWVARPAAKPILILFTVSALLVALAFGIPPGASADAPAAPDVVTYLEKTIAWYRQLELEQEIAVEPSDFLVVNNDRLNAGQVVQFSFDFARADSESAAPASGASGVEAQGQEGSRYQGLLQLSDKLDKNVRDLQQELETFRRESAAATGARRTQIESTLAETQSELDLAVAQKDAVAGMVDFTRGSSTGGLGATGLRSQIEALARSVPSALANPGTPKDGAAPFDAQFTFAPAGDARRAEPSGIWGLAADLFSLSRRIRVLDQRIQLTDELARDSKELRAPFVNALKELSDRGDVLAKQADSANPTALVQVKAELDGLTKSFKQTTGIVLPLSKQAILLGQYKQSLVDWQTSIRSRYTLEWRSLLVRLGVLALFLTVLLVVAELWRRTIIRYVHDFRRRYQFLLLRKIVLSVAIAVVVAFAFASELGSVATFAGLITAGVAVALQSVILSVAGYFFLIGRYGIRVGDRVQIAGVRGEVVDIGLVRLHLMELGSGESETPSGRVVAFPNSIVFQSTAGLFKQIPGTNFAWHEITLVLSPECDYAVAEQRVHEAVEAAFSEYQDEIERQHQMMERTFSYTSVEKLRPRSWLHLNPSGLEVTIRFPVDSQHAAEIDNRITRELLKAVDRPPALELAGSRASSVQLRTDPSPSEVTSG